MRAIRGTGRGRVTLLAVLAAVVVVSSAMFAAAAAAKPGITVQVSPASQTVQRGQSVSYTVTLTSSGGFAGGSTTLTASKLPKGTTAAFVPSDVNLGATGSKASTLTVTTSSSTPMGATTFDIVATSGKTSGSVSAGLTVNPTSSLAMSASPASVTMESGSTAVYALQLTRTSFAGSVTFTVTGLPGGATAAFSPNPTTGSTSTLQVSVPDDTPDGTYTLGLSAAPSGGSPSATATVSLVIDTSKRPFEISGDLARPLYPGVSRPLELTLTNTSKKRLAVTNLGVSLGSLTRSQAAIDAGLACTPGDYAITQFSGPYPLELAKGESKTLTALGVPESQWPHVAMLNTASNQDGCKGASLTLKYTGSGQGD